VWLQGNKKLSNIGAEKNGGLRGTERVMSEPLVLLESNTTMGEHYGFQKVRRKKGDPGENIRSDLLAGYFLCWGEGAQPYPQIAPKKFWLGGRREGQDWVNRRKFV